MNKLVLALFTLAAVFSVSDAAFCALSTRSPSFHSSLPLWLGLRSAVCAAKASASHILMKDEAALKAVADEIAGGADFAEKAKEHSTCPSGKRGGDLGSFGSGAMVKEFDAVAFDDDYALDTVHGPIKTEFGYHLIVVKKRTGLSAALLS